MRIEFDSAASCKGTSLNDTMLKEQSYSEMSWKPVALEADIKEMFSQVVLAEKHRRYHRFLWRNLDLTKTVDVYEAVRLVFGNKASPYLAQFVVCSDAQDFEDKHPAAALVVLLNMYMDDILDSENPEGDAIHVRDDLMRLLSDAGFRGQKRCSSNRAKVLDDIPKKDRATGVKLEESELPSVKTLGVQWNAREDVFTVSI